MSNEVPTLLELKQLFVDYLADTFGKEILDIIPTPDDHEIGERVLFKLRKGVRAERKEPTQQDVDDFHQMLNEAVSEIDGAQVIIDPPGSSGLPYPRLVDIQDWSIAMKIPAMEYLASDTLLPKEDFSILWLLGVVNGQYCKQLVQIDFMHPKVKSIFSVSYDREYDLNRRSNVYQQMLQFKTERDSLIVEAEADSRILWTKLVQIDSDVRVHRRPITNMIEKGYKGGLVSRVRNKFSRKRYVISTAKEIGRDYWSTAVFPGVLFGFFPNFFKKMFAIIRNTEKDAHEVHWSIKDMLTNSPDSDWFEKMPNSKPDEGWSPDAVEALESRCKGKTGKLTVDENMKQVEDIYFNMDLSDDPRAEFAQAALRFWRMGSLDEALISYSDALELSPRDSMLLLNRGNLRFEMGKFADALKDFEAAKLGEPQLSNHLFTNYDIIQSFGVDSPLLLKVSENMRLKKVKSP